MMPDMPPEAPQPSALPPHPPAASPPAAVPFYPPPFVYPYWLVPPKQEYPVPEGRVVPKIWLAVLVALTLAAVGMAFGGALSVGVSASPFHTTYYRNSLAQNDGAWQLRDTALESCSYAKGGLDARDNSADGLVSPCRLSGSNLSNLRLSVRILPQAQLDYALSPAIFVHSDVAILFAPTTGIFAVYAPAVGQTPSTTTPVETNLIYLGETDQWFSDGLLSNTVIVQVQNDIYTIAVNGAQVYHGDFNGQAVSLPASGSVALGAYPPNVGPTGEAAYADLTIMTP